MTEAEWVELMVSELKGQHGLDQEGLSLQAGLKVAYGCEIRSYGLNQSLKALALKPICRLLRLKRMGVGSPEW